MNDKYVQIQSLLQDDGGQRMSASITSKISDSFKRLSKKESCTGSGPYSLEGGNLYSDSLLNAVSTHLNKAYADNFEDYFNIACLDSFK